MSIPVFINLPVSDLERAKAFHEAIGFRIEPKFTDENASCVVIDEEHVYLMLLTREYFGTFTTKTIIEPRSHVQSLTALSLDSREAVDRVLERGVAAGGSEPHEPRDLGFMYSRDLEDPDGHIFEFFWMDPVAAVEGPPSE